MTTVSQSLEAHRIIRDFYTVEDDYVNKMSHVKARRCFVCGCSYEIGDKVSVAITGEGNKTLCSECVSQIEETP